MASENTLITLRRGAEKVGAEDPAGVLLDQHLKAETVSHRSV